jgi:hypothetical protein
MLHMRDTRFHTVLQFNVLPGIVIQEEGVALVFTKYNGETYVKPSAGEDGEIFAGVSFERFTPAGRLPFIREFEVPESGVLILPRTAAEGSAVSVYEGKTALDVATGDTAPSDSSAVLNGERLLFNPDTAKGRRVRVQLMYSPTVEEAQSIYGGAPFGGLASATTGEKGRITIGEVGTSCYDASADWSEALTVALGENGNFVPGTPSTAIPGVVVRNSPSAANNYLVLQLNVA